MRDFNVWCLLLEKKSEQCWVHPQATVVIDETHLAKPVHKEAYPRPGRADYPTTNRSYRLATGEAGQKCSSGAIQLPELASSYDLDVTCRSTGKAVVQAQSRLYQLDYTRESRMEFSLLTNA